ncbi:ornithine-oxoacid aminotransferase [Knoellia sinensis KCTC 19936]|uniref:ornithine aminotransferase n=1 Tax=Knoellia sinensis KCTC 19936 TaxID=1385520 RepID=A0A0A0IZC6_9MICO|nr:ornithine--oxo-acid transaminase [Knoellia sinensis]KGN30495.1 ornithine-oxoacid aminotransferase [Knoellia sinensis KCTC 19936]
MTPETTGTTHAGSTEQHIETTERYAAHNYHPLPVVIASGEGVWVTDVDGKRYLDCLAGYSALNFGHSHPQLVERARQQLGTLTLTSRAFFNDQLGPFSQALAELTAKDMVLPMNSGAEAVETAIKVSRRWGYEVKNVPEDQANIIVMEGNFHGRTTTIVSFSDDKVAHDNYGPYTPGFRTVRYGDIESVRAAMDEFTVAVLFEPIQGEGGVVVPPEGFLRDLRALCSEQNVLMVADEIQSGLARTGTTFACDLEEVVPDMYILGKALGGGLYPVSAVAANTDVLGVITPGSHGSTFGGNPLAAAIGHEVCRLLATGEFQDRARRLGERLLAGLEPLVGHGLDEVRVRGLWAGLDVTPGGPTGRELCERLMERGILAKDTHGMTIRLAPPLVITEDEVDQLVAAVTESLST